MKSIVADALGLFVLALLLLGMTLLLEVRVSGIAFAFVYLGAASFSLFIWHHSCAPTHPVSWLVVALCSALLGLVSLAYFRISSGLFFWQSEPAGSRLFDYAITMLISPGFTIVALIGAVRSLVAKEG